MPPTALRRLLRHDRLLAAGAFLVLASLWFLPLFAGRQLGQSYYLYQTVPWRSSALGRTLPARAIVPDVAFEGEPWARIQRRQLGGGHLPLWNPYEYGGTTLAGNMQSAPFFPLTWLLLLLPLGYAWGAAAIAKLVLAGLGTYVLARRLEAGPRGAFLAGTVYLLSAPLMAWLQWPVGGEIALFPWLLAAATALVRAPGPRPLAGLGLASGLLILAGHPESAVIALSAAAVYVTALILGDRSLRWRVWLRAALATLGGVALGIAVAAAALVPFLQAYPGSITATGDQSFGIFQHLPLSSAVDYVLPHLFGDGKPRVYGDPFFNAVALYVGFPALVLAVLAAVRHRRRPAVLALLVMALAGALAVFGVPPVRWVVDSLPPWKSIKIADRGTFVAALALSALAGIGWSSLEARALPRRRVALLGAGLGLLIVGAFLAGQAGGNLSAPADLKRNALVLSAGLLVLTLALIVSLRRLGPWPSLALGLVLLAGSVHELHGFNVTLPPAQAYPPRTGAIAALQRQPWPFRMGVLRPAGGPSVLPPNVAAGFGLESMEGYDFPLSNRWADLELRVLGFPALRIEVASASGLPSRPALTAYRMFNTRYYMAPPGFRPPPALQLEPLYRGPDATVLRDPHALPRAYVVPRTRAESYAATLTSLADGRLNPRREALVPEGTATPDPPAGSRFRAARVEQLGPDHLRVRLPPGAAGWLVLANSFSPTWEAEAGGRRLPIRPTNLAAMGVPVPAGVRTIDFRLARTGFWAGAAVSAVGLAVALLLLLADRRRRRTRRAAA